MNASLRLLQRSLALMALLIAMPLVAQEYRYSVYIDVDSNPGTGCSDNYPNAPGQTIGAEVRLTAVVDGNPPMVQQVLRSVCDGAAFGVDLVVGGGYPVALNEGLDGTDSIELTLPQAPLTTPEMSLLRFEIGARTDRGNEDLLLTTDGTPGGQPILLDLPVVAIPAIGVLGALLLALVLIVVAWRTQKKWQRRTLLSVGLLLGIGSSVAATTLIADGNLLDWGGFTPLAVDPQGDSTNNDEAADLRAFFAAPSGNGLVFRIDVTDAENQPPEANPQSVTTLEDNAVLITLTGSDVNGDPLTFSIDSTPTLGTLGPVTPLGPTSASVTYTPNADENGADSFTFIANDGVVGSAPATVSIDITPVNDAPSFTASSPPTVNEDAGPQSLVFASFSPGPANESGQNVLAYMVSDLTNAALFVAGPLIANDGTLSYTTAPDANGSSSFTVMVQDNGGTANAGIDTSLPQTFTLTVNPINDAPSFVVGPDQTVPEDAGAQLVDPWATAISAGPPDETGQNLLFIVSDNSNLALFSVSPSVTADGALSYTPADDVNGTATITLRLMDDGGAANGGIDSSDPQTFTITVTPINDVPSFVVGPDQAVNEDAGPQVIDPWATDIDDGEPEVTQNLNFEITANSNAALFSEAPSVSPSGVLNYTPADDANGSATITLRLIDDGGTANGGVDTSAEQSFEITVNAVNDAPSFSAADPATVLEGSGPQTVVGWSTFSPGPANESGQNVLAYQVTALGNPALFSAAPSVANNGTLSYTPAPDANGSSTFTVTVQDDGGTANGGVDTSDPQTFTISVTTVNDVPSFTVGPDVIVDEDAGAQVISPWATAISAGPPDEAGQALTFMITANSNAALFSSAPSIAADGSLSFNPADDANGSAELTVVLMDDGGTANGGVDTSAAQTFTITVDEVNDAPVNSVPGAQSVDEDQTLLFDAANAISVSDLDIGTGLLNVVLEVNGGELDVTASGAATLTGNGTALLGIEGLLADVNATLLSLGYTPDPDFNGSDTLSVLSDDNGNTGSGGAQTDLSTVELTINPINDAPDNTVPGDQTDSSGAIEFSSVNGNAISVFDVDAESADIQVDLSVADGALTAIATPGVVISNNGSAAITLLGPQDGINLALDGLIYTPAVPGTDTLVMLSDDLGNSGAGGPLTDSSMVTLLIDEAPSVDSVSPANGATQQASSVALTINFSEAVDTLAGAVAVSCAPSGANASSTAQANVVAITLTGAAIAAAPGDVCSVLVTAASVSDVDSIDPPDLMAADFSSSYSIDTPPEFVSSSPAVGAVVGTDITISVTFDEPVNAAAGALSLSCAGSIPGTVSGSGSETLVFTADSDLPEGASCTLLVLASSISDVDLGDPPDNLPADVLINFSTDAAPEVITTSPVNAAANVTTTTSVSFQFSEAIDAAAGAITLNCAGPIAGTLNGSGTDTLVFTPAAALPEDTGCVATAVAALISDADSIDPPDGLVADEVINFATDAAPAVISTVPTNGALSQPSTDTITINFSEPVNFDTAANAANSSFDLECPVSTNFTVITASPATSVVLDPADLSIAGQTCTLTILAAGISDVDAGDPPDNMAADVVVVIEYDDPAIANDDSYDVNPHLALAIDTAIQGGGVLANDTIGSAVITGFGPIGTCAAAVPNGANAITTAVGGRVVLNLNGSFSYGPPAGLVGNGAGGSPEDGFCYTLTGGDTADVGFELALHELVWFADAAYAGANGPADGTQARPHVNLPAIAAIDTANDTIHVAFNASSYTGITLEAGERLIGAGSASDLATITGITPVAGSAFPALGGTRPTVAGSGIALGTNNLIRGLNIGDTGGNDGLVAGAAFGTLTMSEASILGTGRAMNYNAAGTLNLALDEITSSGGFNGIVMSGVGGTITVGVGGTNIGSTTGGDAIFVQLAPAATNFNFGATTINSASGGVTGNVNAPTSVIGFSSLAITTPTGAGLTANSGTITIGGASNTINSTGGPALSVGSTNTGAGWTFSTLSSTNSATNGIIVNNISGGGITGNGGSISGSTGTAFQALNGLGGGVSYAGSIIKTSAGRLVDISGAGGGNVTLSGDMDCGAACSTGAGNQGLRISGRTSGAITVSGATKIFRPNPAASNTMVLFDNNTGATINLSGTTAVGAAALRHQGTAYAFSGGGTINLSGIMEAVVQGARTLDIDGVTLSGATGIGGFNSGGALGVGVPSIEITNSAAPAGVSFGQPLFIDHDDAGESGGGIRLLNNTGTFNFPSVLRIVSTNTPALTASNAGTITLGNDQAGLMINDSGLVISILNTTIGAAGVTTQRVQSIGGANAILLTNTGAGPFTVSGTGVAGSGGLIADKSTDAVILNNTGGLVTLNYVLIEQIGNMAGVSNTVSGHDAIQGLNVNGGLSMTGTVIRRISDNAIHGGDHTNPALSTVWNGLTLNGVTIEDTNRYHIPSRGDAANEGAVRIVGLRGAVNISNSTFRRGAEFLDIFMTAGTLNMSVTGSVFENAYKEFTAADNSPIASVGNQCIDVTVRNAGTANVTIGDRTVPAAGNSFLNCRIGSVRALNDAGSTGTSTFVVARNNFTVDDGSSGVFCNPACQSADFDFPMGGLLGWNLGSGNMNSVIENNNFTDVTNASGGVGQLTLISEGGGLHQSLVQGNSFIRPGNAPMLVQARNVANSNMRLRAVNNTVTGGPSLCTIDAACAGGYPTPGLRTLFDSSNGVIMDLTLDNNSFAEHDQGFDPGETVEVRSFAPDGGQVCTNFNNNRAADGYSLETLGAGSISTVGAGSCPIGGPSANCQSVLGNRNNLGGSNNLLTNPPFVRVLDAAVNVVAGACPVPSGGPF